MKARFQLSILADGNTLSVGTDTTVGVKLPGTSTSATLYSNSAGTATTTNPLTDDSAGNVACYVTPGRQLRPHRHQILNLPARTYQAKSRHG